MYTPKINPEHIRRLYHMRESINQQAGKKVTTIIDLLDEALIKYLPEKEKECNTVTFEECQQQCVSFS